MPTFKFALEKSQGKVIGTSFGKEATVTQLPISKGIAGVSMRLEPGRCANCTGTPRRPSGRSSSRAGSGRRSSIRRATPRRTISSRATSGTSPAATVTCSSASAHEPCHFILIFDNGYFSEFGTFSITDWIGHTPKPLLAKNFGLPESAFDRFPKEEVYFARGAVPPEKPAAPLQGRKLPPQTHKYRLLAQPPHAVYKGGREWRVDSSRFPISKTITGVILDLDPGALRELHWHPNADEWQYVIAGQVSVTLFGSHGRFRIETWRRATSATSRKGTATRSRTSATKPAAS